MQLPILDILPELKTVLAENQAVILQAPPGAGKTTRVPLALLDADWLRGQTILMLEPRRLAAGNAARYMAELLREKVGRTVGYTIRYQRQVSKQTRIEVVTEGILTRRLQSDPELQGIGLVIFDEFHERNLNSDLALALCRDAQQGLREDLKILIMSATLDGAPLAKLLQAPLLTSEGRSYPVTVQYAKQEQGSLVEATAAAIRRALRESAGDILAFLPGAGEIHRCREALKEIGAVDIRPLYGSLPYPEQEKAIRPGGRRKVVLATNIAETSLTIEGVRVVIDGGYARQPRFDPASGLTRLDKVRISRASAVQRAGRAGRLGPGSCYRLWSEGTQGSLLPFTPPEIRNADLAPLALELANWGIADPLQLTWLDPPPEGGLAAAKQLLQLLGALDDALQLTPLGKRLAQLPVHPRLGRMLLLAERLECLPLACDLLALLSEPDLRSQRGEARQRSENDLLDRLELLWKQRRQGEPGAFQTIERTAGYWKKHFNLKSAEPRPECGAALIGTLLACAFPDRIGRRREEGSDRYLFASGRGGRLSARSALRNEEFLVATELTGRRGEEGQILQAGRLELAEIVALYPNRPWQKQIFWDDRDGRVRGRSVQLLGKLILAEKPCAVSAAETTGVMLEVLRTEGLGLLNWSREVETLRARVATLAALQQTDSWPQLADDQLLETLDQWLAPYLGRCKNRNDLKRLDLLAALHSLFDWSQLRRLDKLAPERLQVAGGSSIRLQYRPDGAPVLAVKLQEMFGEADTPRIAGGKLAVQLHLLSPAGRPLQVTQNLRSFWDEVYPEVKREMKGRYPKHPWPDDPWQAAPTRHTRRRRPPLA
jgi:ATP-dependent helicase HrpB